MILELTREIRLGWNVQHEGKRFSVARISRIGVSSRNKKICTARQQTNREFVNGLNSHYDPHRNFFRRRINDLQRGRCIARATDDPAAHHTNINGDQWKSRGGVYSPHMRGRTNASQKISPAAPPPSAASSSSGAAPGASAAALHRRQP